MLLAVCVLGALLLLAVGVAVGSLLHIQEVEADRDYWRDYAQQLWSDAAAGLGKLRRGFEKFPVAPDDSAVVPLDGTGGRYKPGDTGFILNGDEQEQE